MKTDPTRTKSLRGKFERDLARRFKQIEKAIIQAIVKEDRLGLLPLTFNVVHEWAGLTDQQKLDQFSDFLDDEINAALVNQDDRFWERYIQDGYEKGAGRAFTDTNKRQFASASAGGQMFMAGKRAQFTSGMLQGPESADKLKLLAQRTFSDIQGVTDTMRTQLRRNLMDGLVQGQNPNVIARSMRDQMGINLRRAKTIARTEVIRAHAEGQLDAMERMGIEEVGVMVEWSTAGDTRVCPMCNDVDGMILRVKEAHGLLPRHPNCRCAFLPANVGETRRGQVRGRQDVQEAIKDSQSRQKRTTWGKSTNISEHRPEPPTKERGHITGKVITPQELNKPGIRTRRFNPRTGKVTTAPVKAAKKTIPKKPPVKKPPVKKPPVKAAAAADEVTLENLKERGLWVDTASFGKEVDSDTAKHIAKVLSSYEDEFPGLLKNINIRAENMGEDVAMALRREGGSQQLLVSKDVLKNRRVLDKTLKSAKKSKWLAGDTLDHVLDHEMAHVIDFVPPSKLGIIPPKRFAKAYIKKNPPTRKGLSGYGTTSAEESFAEAWAAIRSGRKLTAWEQGFKDAMIRGYENAKTPLPPWLKK